MESTKPIGDTKSKDSDRDALVSIVKEMTESTTGAQSTRRWAEDALWFDIPPFASRGVKPALNFFDRVFGNSSLVGWTSSKRTLSLTVTWVSFARFKMLTSC